MCNTILLREVSLFSLHMHHQSSDDALPQMNLGPASSYHPSGVVMAYVDGSVKLHNDNIDAGDPTLKSTDGVHYSGSSGRDILRFLGSINGVEVNSSN